MPPGQKGRRTAPIKIPEYMTFRPTWEEFKDFNKYMHYLESQGAHKAGVAKIIPPPEWIPRREGYANVEELNLTVQTPLKQHFNQVGSKGAYQTKSIVSQPMPLKEYKQLTFSKQYKTPSHTSYEELEEKYWKTLSIDPPPVYGCDVPESMTDKDQTVWNIQNLGTILNELKDTYKQTIRGLNTPYCYFGMWRTTFSWHVEDMDLHSINYLHFGMPKTWYVVPPQYGYLMERAAKELYPNIASWCSSFMRHKTSLLSPKVMDQLGVPYQKVVQEERNAIIVFPYAYHSGFNHGFNCAESSNFALERWIEYGKRCRQCDCGRSRVMFSMDAFVKKYQGDSYESWKNGTDIAPHPEDPPDVREEFDLRAKDPEAYAKLKREQMIKLNEKARKARLSAPTLEDDGLEIEEDNTPQLDPDCTTKVLDVYQHHQLTNVKVAVDPETMEIIGSGKELLEEYLDIDNPEVRKLIAQGVLIKIGDKTVIVRKKGDAASSKESEFIKKPVHVYEHIHMNLEAFVDPETSELFGDQMPELIDFLGEDNEIKDLIQAGVFNYAYDAEITGRNSNQSESEINLPQQTKRPLSPTISYQNKKYKGDSGESYSMRFISASVYRHLDLEEMITITPDCQKVIGNVSEYMKRALVESTIPELIQEGCLVKVGQRKVCYEETNDFRKRVILKRCAVEMNLRGIGDFKNNKPRKFKIELFTHHESNKSVFVITTKDEKRETCKRAGEILETETISGLFNGYFLAESAEPLKYSSVNKQSANIDAVIAALDNKCKINKCDIHRNSTMKLSSKVERINCLCKLVGVFKVKRSFLKDDMKIQSNAVIVTVNEYGESVTIEDLTKGKMYIIKQDVPPRFITMEEFETEEEDMSGDHLFLQTFDENGGGHGKRKQSSPSKVDFIQDPNQKISSVTKYPKEIDDIRAPYDSEQEFEPGEESTEKDASLALALSILSSDESSEEGEESEDDPDYGKKGADSFEWKSNRSAKKKKKTKEKAKKTYAREIQVLSQIPRTMHEVGRAPGNIIPMEKKITENKYIFGGKASLKRNEIVTKQSQSLLKTTTAILEYFEMDDLNRIFNSTILAKMLNKEASEVLAVLRVFCGFKIVKLLDTGKQRFEWLGIDPDLITETLERIYRGEPVDNEGIERYQTWNICVDLLKILMDSRRGEGHNLTHLGPTLYEDDVTVRLTEVASVLEGLKIIEKNIFKVENYEYVTYIYVGPDIAGKEGAEEFALYNTQANLKRVIIPVQKSYVDPILFLPYLQKRNKAQK